MADSSKGKPPVFVSEVLNRLWVWGSGFRVQGAWMDEMLLSRCASGVVESATLDAAPANRFERL